MEKCDVDVLNISLRGNVKEIKLETECRIFLKDEMKGRGGSFHG